MFKLLCLSCVLALMVGSAFRFTLLMAGLAKARVLPESWRRWLYDLNRVEKVH